MQVYQILNDVYLKFCNLQTLTRMRSEAFRDNVISIFVCKTFIFEKSRCIGLVWSMAAICQLQYTVNQCLIKTVVFLSLLFTGSSASVDLDVEEVRHV